MSKCSWPLCDCKCNFVKGKVFNGQVLLSGESAATVCGVNYQLLAVMLLKQANGQLVAVDQRQLQTMRSETVDQINSPLPLAIYKSVSPEGHLRSTYSICVATTGNRVLILENKDILSRKN